MRNHLQKTKVGVIWSFFNQGGTQVLNLLVTFVLARLITPEEFGIIGMIAVFTGFAKIFVDLGFSNALIQKKSISKKDIDTVFTFNIISGLVLTGIFFFFSSLIADFYGEAILSKITKVYSPIFLIMAFGGVNQAMIIKAMEFKKNTIASIVSTIVSSTIAIAMAYLGFGVWSILSKILSEQIITTLLVMVLFPVRQQPKFYYSSFRALAKNGFNMAGDSVINYWSRNADNLIIGKFLGDGPLGIYSKAYAIMMLPLRNISRVIGKVMFPSFSLLQNEVEKIKSIYLKATRLIAFVTFPLMMGLAILAEPFVLVTFGENWVQMIPIIRILAAIGAIQSVFTLNGVIFNSLGKPEISLRISIIRSITNIGAFIMGLKLGGLNGLAMAYAIVTLLSVLPSFYFAGKQINVSILEMFKNLFNATGSTIIMGLSIFYIQKTIESFFSTAILRLLIPTLCGIMIYYLIGYLLGLEELKLAKKIFIQKKKPKVI
ncbi:hypothetical protein C7S20_17455 [Christiangramia fulva]|uniref:Uncharacterized protein n=1 Tax=Christiangramia fulva TaxID=2126553 RepID=A0A2R3Z9P8_9FLAO|nr:lipopolysaccharide biosynthesis protein [Christiangramia fulva]AVR46904.1 hypothetical protein C7S20_17455 [Christiangramia fulva]